MARKWQTGRPEVGRLVEDEDGCVEYVADAFEASLWESYRWRYADVDPRLVIAAWFAAVIVPLGFKPRRTPCASLTRINAPTIQMRDA